MNIYEEDGSGNYLNMGVVYCEICFKYIENSLSLSEKDNHDHICNNCQDKIDLDDKYHNESHNLGLFKHTRMKFIDIIKKK